MLCKIKEPLEGRLGTRMNPSLGFKGTMALTNTLISGFYPLDLRQQSVKTLNLWSTLQPSQGNNTGAMIVVSVYEGKLELQSLPPLFDLPFCVFFSTVCVFSSYKDNCYWI